MKSRVAILLAAGFMAVAQTAPAQTAAAVVEGVQMPAWVERGGKRSPLAVGTELKAGDAVKTGAGSRAMVKLSEGSLVKLGENGTLKINEIAPESGGIFKAALHVVEGAFRFTTDVLSKARRREVSIAVATVIAGVRGTDLWGKSAPDRQTVCLIEGAIEVGAAGEKPVTMNRARQFYRRENSRTLPVGFVTLELLKEWSLETEIEAGKGATRRGGKWTVNLASADNRAAVRVIYDQLRENGYAAEIRSMKAGAKYQVGIANLPSKEDAEALAAKLRGQYGVAEPRVSM